MKKMNLKRLFVSDRDRELAKMKIEIAMHWIDTLESVDNEDDRLECMLQSKLNLKAAADLLGFKSINDMNEYHRTHGKF